MDRAGQVIKINILINSGCVAGSEIMRSGRWQVDDLCIHVDSDEICLLHTQGRTSTLPLS